MVELVEDMGTATQQVVVHVQITGLVLRVPFVLLTILILHALPVCYAVLRVF